MEIPSPPFEIVDGLLLRVRPAPSALAALLLTPGDDNLDVPSGMMTLFRGQIVLRYGVAYLYRPLDTLIPAWAYDDFQQEYKGFNVLRFLADKGERFPRADIVGWRAGNGKRDDLYVKELDMARPYRVFAYSNPDERMPIHRVDVVGVLSDPGLKPTLLHDPGPESVSDMLYKSLPVYRLGWEYLPDFASLIDPVEQE